MLRQDSYLNFQLGIGDTRRDSSSRGEFVFAELVPQYLETLYNASDLAHLIVNAPIEDALTETVQFSSPRVEAAAKEYELYEVAKKAWLFARLYGGAAVLPVRGSTSALATEYSGKEGPAKKYIPIPCKDLSPRGVKDTDPTSDMFDEYPDWVWLNGLQIHRSRLIVFRGEDYAGRDAACWGMSVLQRVNDHLERGEIAEWSMAQQFRKAVEGVQYISGLHKILAAGGESALRRAMMERERTASATSMTLLDAETEKYEKLTADFEEYPEMLDRTRQRISASARISMFRLFGVAASGLNSSNESDMEIWAQEVEKQRTSHFHGPFLRLLQDASGVEDFEIMYPEIRHHTALEKAELYAKNAEADSKYYDLGVLDASDIARGRFADDGEYRPVPNFELDPEEISEFDKTLADAGAAAQRQISTPPPPVRPTSD